MNGIITSLKNLLVQKQLEQKGLVKFLVIFYTLECKIRKLTAAHCCQLAEKMLNKSKVAC